MATRSSIPAQEFPWTEDPGGSLVHGVPKSQTGLRTYAQWHRGFFHELIGICISSWEKYLFKSVSYCLTDLLLSCKNCLNILDIGLISEIWWFAIISFILWVVCTFLIVPFEAKKLKFFLSHTMWLVKAHQLRIKPMSPASGTQSLNHWTTMKFLNFEVQFIYFFFFLVTWALDVISEKPLLKQVY